jgi:hypothetical protein
MSLARFIQVGFYGFWARLILWASNQELARFSNLGFIRTHEARFMQTDFLRRRARWFYWGYFSTSARLHRRGFLVGNRHAQFWWVSCGVAGTLVLTGFLFLLGTLEPCGLLTSIRRALLRSGFLTFVDALGLFWISGLRRRPLWPIGFLGPQLTRSMKNGLLGSIRHAGSDRIAS